MPTGSDNHLDIKYGVLPVAQNILIESCLNSKLESTRNYWENKLGYTSSTEGMTKEGKIMTNDNIPITNAAMAEAAALPIDEFFDKEGNLIPFDLDETFVQDEADIINDGQTYSETVDVGNTSH